MGFLPIARTTPQYMDGSGDPYSGAVLKAYEDGTTTNINMATDSTGGTLVTDIALNASGYPEVSGNIVIPHINQAYKLSLYPTQAAADANSGAIWTIDNLSTGTSFGEKNAAISSNTVLTQDDHANAHLVVTGSTTLTLPPIAGVANAMVFSYRNAGTDTITFDGNAAEEINGATTLTAEPGASGIVVAQDTDWEATGAKDAQVDQTNTFSKTQTWSKGADVASATALTLGTDGNYFDITGTIAITSIATKGIGTVVKLHFDGILTLTHHATDLILPGAANITTAAGDEAEFVEYASGDWRCTNYERADGKSVITAGAGLIQIDYYTSSDTWTKPASTTAVEVTVVGGGGGGGGTTGAGGTGGTSSFGSHCSATGGAGGAVDNANFSVGGVGGVGSNGDLNISGGDGGNGFRESGGVHTGGRGGSTILGGGGRGGAEVTGSGDLGEAGGNYGGGGGGGAFATNTVSGGGGGGGASIEYITSGLGSTETITVGAGGTAGTGSGVAGAAGVVIVKSYA